MHIHAIKLTRQIKYILYSTLYAICKIRNFIGAFKINLREKGIAEEF